MRRLFSKEHLHFILGDHVLFYRFSSFHNQYRPHLVPAFRYLEMRKVVKAIEYANAVIRRVHGSLIQIIANSLDFKQPP
jgi:hypothetical protein